MKIIANSRGLDLAGCNFVEVSSSYDTTGNTALIGANIIFEMLSILPDIKYRLL
jgi:guanidinobutyrase